jgi:Flp pilus assembly protein TadG
VDQTKKVSWYVTLIKRFRGDKKGQAAVEFTLVFILLVIVAWIPADFGLALYTGQIAQNAVREGARIAAADPTLAPGTTQCTMPACYSAGNILKETGVRLPAAMLGASTVTVQYPDPAGPSTGCGKLVRVSVSGKYPFFFYKVLNLVGIDVNATIPTITRFTSMRWEHQC